VCKLCTVNDDCSMMTSNGGSSSCNNGSTIGGGSLRNGHVNGGPQQQQAVASPMIRVESHRVHYSEQAIVADYMYVLCCFSKRFSLVISLTLARCCCCYASFFACTNAVVVDICGMQVPNDHCGWIRGETSRTPTQVSHRASRSQGTFLCSGGM
jgi:hypothetical protein